MTAYELLCFLAKRPDAKVAIIEGEDYENKKCRLSVYVSAENEIVIQIWD